MKEEEENKIKFINDQLKINQQGFETINNSIVEDEKKLQNSFNDKKDIPNFSQIVTSDDINPDNNQTNLDDETKEKFDIKMNEIIKQNNQNVVTDALSNKERLGSVFLQEVIAQNIFEKEDALKAI